MSPVTLNLEGSKTNLSTKCALDDLSKSVAKCKRIVVVTGAGISCSSGIPDFRSSGGLYNLVKARFPDIVLKGRDLFDASLFRDPESTAAFFCFISQLKQKIDLAEPTPTHDFIKTLESKGKLLRSYTQNIDGMEEKVGIAGHHAGTTENAAGKSKAKGKSSALKRCRNVQLHGDIHRVRCQTCSAEYPCMEEHLKLFDNGLSPDCPECLQRSNARVARSARALRVGSLRPAIVLYDEVHPLGDEIGIVQSSDLARKPDMLIIMGTSLRVHGLKKLVKEFAKTVHNHRLSSTPSSSSSSPSKVRKTSSAKAHAGKVIFVNKTPPGAEWADMIDYHVAGETDKWTQRVIEDWKKMFPGDWEVQQTLLSSGMFKAAKEIVGEAQALAKGNVKGNSKSAKESKKKALQGPSDDEEENIPPPPPSQPDAMVLSTPDAHRLLKSKPKPISSAIESPAHMVISPAPISPSKRVRTQSQSHYSSAAQAALEASPSKRRIKPLPKSDLDLSDSEGKPFFGKNTTNSIGMNEVDDETDDDLDMGDLSMQSPQKPKFPLRLKIRAEVKPIPKSRMGARRAARMQNTAMAADTDVFAA